MQRLRSQLIEAKTWYEKHERHITSLALLAGFIWDSITLRRVDLWLDNLILLAYLVVAGLSIIIANLHEAKRLRSRFAQKVGIYAPVFMQFAFGGLFSGYAVFYFRSASFFASWPFLLFLIVLLVGNEVFRKRYAAFAFQMSIFFIAVFSYTIFSLPVVVGRIGASVFIGSGLISIAVIALFLYGLFRLMPDRVLPSRKPIAWSIGSIYILFHIMYFANIIPPIPLALKESGIYHQVTPRQAGGYEVRIEPAPWYVPLQDWNSTVHTIPGGRVYSFSSVFAPTRIATDIFHRWSHYNKERREWEDINRIGFPIQGGRDGGYRGYTFMTNLQEGTWRVDVITGRDQILGRTQFKVQHVDELPELETAIY